MPLNFRPFPRDYLPLEVAIELKQPAGRDRLASILERLAGEDTTFRFMQDQESGETRLRAASERQIDAALKAIVGEATDLSVGEPQIAYREFLSAAVETDYTHKKQGGGTGEFARVKMRFEPSQRSMSNTFINGIIGGSVPAEFVSGVEKGFLAVTHSGPLVGFPIVACRATLLDGAYHDVDSSSLAFEIATRAAFRETVSQGAFKLLEPYLEIDITVPEAFSAVVIADFKSRRGVNTAKEASPGVVAIYGFAPLANLIGYEAHLKSITQGAAAYSWKPAGLEEVPAGSGPPAFTSAAAKRG